MMTPRSMTAIAPIGIAVNNANTSRKRVTNTCSSPNAAAQVAKAALFDLGILSNDLCQQLRLDVAAADYRNRLFRCRKLFLMEQPCRKCYRSTRFGDDASAL